MISNVRQHPKFNLGKHNAYKLIFASNEIFNGKANKKFWGCWIFDRSLVESGPRNSFVVCHFVCHSLKFLSISSSFSFRQVSTCFQIGVKSFRKSGHVCRIESNRIIVFQQVWTCFKNCIKSYHTILTSLDMFIESHQIVSQYFSISEHIFTC